MTGRWRMLYWLYAVFVVVGIAVYTSVIYAQLYHPGAVARWMAVRRQQIAHTFDQAEAPIQSGR